MPFWKLADARNAVVCMDGEAFPRDGRGRRSVTVGSLSDRPRSVAAASGVVLHNLSFKNWRTSRTKASFSHLPLSFFEGCLGRKLRFHIFHFQFWREAISFICLFKKTKQIFSQHGKRPECRWFTKFNMVIFKFSIANCSLNCQRANPRFMVLSIGEWWFASQTCNCVFL